MPLVPGTRIGQYEVVTLLGAGGNARGIMSIAVDTSQPTFHWESPTLLFEASYASFPGLAGPRNYDQAPDGRFLVIKESQGTSPGALVIVKNWFDEIKRLALASR